MGVETVQVMIVEKFSQRKKAGSSESFLLGMVIERSLDVAGASVAVGKVLPCYVNDPVAENIKVELVGLAVKQKVILTNVLKYPNSLRLTKESKVRFFFLFP